MGSIGFGVEIKDASKPLSNDDVLHLLRNGIRTYTQFADELTKELREVKHLEQNLKVLESQMIDINRLYDARTEIVRKLLLEKNKRSMMDIELCKKYLELITHIDDELLPMSAKAYDELQRLVMPEIQIIAQEYVDAKDKIISVSGRASELSNDLYMINKKIIAFKDDINSVHRDIYLIENERAMAPAPKKDMGF